MGWRIWADRGGTFTDVVARSPEGRLVVRKLLSHDPARYDDPVAHAVRGLLGLGEGEPLAAGVVEELRIGTTVATNALLERRGAPALFVATEGFGDALRIGYQNRPDLFARNIRRPEPPHLRVLEVRERVSAEGEVVRAMEEEGLPQAFAEARAAGCESVAVCFMHGWRFPDHERRAAALARAAGFAHVSASHEVNPLVKFVSRGDTTLLDAYLSPVLLEYVARLRRSLGLEEGSGTRLLFMQSNGGLAAAGAFRGKDAILSGPAGGVVGMVETARAAGFREVIGFDMGGTSTDVARFDGEYERSVEAEVAGARLRAPMLRIETVAAGGGSVLRFDGARFRVGPDSAGADPGPRCYGRGGPLAVTDCNAALGRIQADEFPAAFGPGGDAPLDAEAARRGFAELAEEVRRVAGAAESAGGEVEAAGRSVESVAADGVSAAAAAITPEEAAEGFLRIAVENMANAIKKISVQRGYDATGYVLNCFGGAGGQHACRVADALGMETVQLHPLAGVLSAWGIGRSVLRRVLERQLSLPLSAEAADGLAEVFAGLEGEAGESLEAQGAEGALVFERRVLLRGEGSDTSLPVAWGAASEMESAYGEAHLRSFGFVMPEGGLVMEAAVLEASEEEPAAEPAGAAAFGASGTSGGEGEGARGAAAGEGEREGREAVSARPVRMVRAYFEGSWQEVPLYRRAELRAGDEMEGPAIVSEATATTVVEPGWRGRLMETGDLVLRRAVPRPKREAAGTEADPILLEVFNNLFMSVAEQMGATLANTAWSVNIKERLDFSCAVFDAEGRLVANAPHLPVHLGSMGESVRAVREANEGGLRPGRAWMLNAPYAGGTHLPDVTVVAPVFDEAGAELLFFVAARGHHADIGGTTPGSCPPDSRRIEEEGVLIEDFLLVDEGRLREKEVLALLSGGALALPQSAPQSCGSDGADCRLRDGRARAAAGDGAFRAGDGSRLHGPCAGQRRGVRAARNLAPQGRRLRV